MLVTFKLKVIMQKTGFCECNPAVDNKRKGESSSRKKIQKPQNLNFKVSKYIVFHFCLSVCYPKM